MNPESDIANFQRGAQAPLDALGKDRALPALASDRALDSSAFLNRLKANPKGYAKAAKDADVDLDALKGTVRLVAEAQERAAQAAEKPKPAPPKDSD